MLQQVLMVTLGGGIGAALRYLTSEWITSDGFPWATLGVNLIGSFLMGALAIGLAENMISKDLALLLGTGLLGGLFSPVGSSESGWAIPILEAFSKG